MVTNASPTGTPATGSPANTRPTYTPPTPPKVNKPLPPTPGVGSMNSSINSSNDSSTANKSSSSYIGSFGKFIWSGCVKVLGFILSPVTFVLGWLFKSNHEKLAKEIVALHNSTGNPQVSQKLYQALPKKIQDEIQTKWEEIQTKLGSTSPTFFDALGITNPSLYMSMDACLRHYYRDNFQPTHLPKTTLVPEWRNFQTANQSLSTLIQDYKEKPPSNIALAFGHLPKWVKEGIETLRKKHEKDFPDAAEVGLADTVKRYNCMQLIELYQQQEIAPRVPTAVNV